MVRTILSRHSATDAHHEADHRYRLFCCRDKDATQRAIAGAIGTEGDLPIDLQVEGDPHWDVLAKVLAQTHQQN